MTVTPHQPERFTFATFTGMDPYFIADRDTDLYTAWAWCLHVRVPDEYGTGPDAPEAFFQALMLATATANTYLRASDDDVSIPAATGGDSFRAWCEPFPYGGDDEDSRALHLYFAAPDLDAARLAAVGFLALTGLTLHDVALSTGGDWAEQTAIPALNV